MIKNIYNLGDAALYCDFGDTVNKETNLKVINYFNDIREKNITGIKNIAPSYNKLIIYFDLELTNYKKIKDTVQNLDMSTFEEVEKTVNFVKKYDIPFILLHCNSTYPSPIESLNLDLIPVYREKFDVPVGFSGHESGIIGTLTAAIMKAVVIERHITLDKNMKGLDHSSSLEPLEFKSLINLIRQSEKAVGKPIKKITRAEVLQREVVAKSIICSSDIQIGETFSSENLEVKGPEHGLSSQYYFDILDKKSSRTIKKGEYLQQEDLEKSK